MVNSSVNNRDGDFGVILIAEKQWDCVYLDECLWLGNCPNYGFSFDIAHGGDIVYQILSLDSNTLCLMLQGLSGDDDV